MGRPRSCKWQPAGYIDGKISTDYNAVISQQGVAALDYKGAVQPLYFGALRNTLNWKQLSLSCNISFKAGYYFRRDALDYSSLFSSWTGSSEYAQRWQHPGDEKNTNTPSLVYPADPARDLFYTRSTAVIERADHIRLEDITLSYQPVKKLKWLPFEGMRLYIYASNLGLLWTSNKKDIDPYYNNTPAAGKRLAAGLNINF